MGYHTDFRGGFEIDRPVEEKHAAYIRKFNETRRMKRDPSIAQRLPDPIREAAGLNIGQDGAFFVGGKGFHGQDEDASVIDPNTPPGQVEGYGMEIYAINEKLMAESRVQPSLWCQWTLNDANDKLVWDGGEKFYHYVEWLKYMIENFFKPWNYVLNGKVKWQGEEMDDRGEMIVENNVVTTRILE